MNYSSSNDAEVKMELLSTGNRTLSQEPIIKKCFIRLKKIEYETLIPFTKSEVEDIPNSFRPPVGLRSCELEEMPVFNFVKEESKLDVISSVLKTEKETEDLLKSKKIEEMWNSEEFSILSKCNEDFQQYNLYHGLPCVPGSTKVNTKSNVEEISTKGVCNLYENQTVDENNEICKNKGNLKIINTEENDTFQCDVCRECFKTKAGICVHLRKHLEKQYKCKTCCESFSLRSDLYKHSSVHKFKCEICEKLFIHKSQLTEHLKIHNKVMEFKCDMCNKYFKFKYYLVPHIIRHNNIRSYKCEMCKKSYNTKYALALHLLIHGAIKLYSCNVCGKKFTHKSNLHNHIKTVHEGIKPYKCRICEKYFQRKCHLVRHLMSHSDYKPYKCEICAKNFSDKSMLLRHTKFHNTNIQERKIFQCKICEKYFTTKSILSKHMTTIHEEHGISCEICGKVIKNNMRRHMQIHGIGKMNNAERYKCDICEKTFTGKYSISRHMLRIHNHDKRNEKYTCDICMKVYRVKGSFNVHMKLHTGIMYKCDVCSKCFTSKTAIISHLQTHLIEKRHKCNFCRHSFGRKSQLSAHLVHHKKF